jgi:epoxyqueuosine reductase QueG
VKAWVEQEIAATVAERMASPGTRSRWRPPLVAYASARDPMFAQLKHVVRETHAMPHDLLPHAESVIAWFLPFERSIPRSNHAGRYASDAWQHAYVETNDLIRVVSERLAAGLRERGFEAVTQAATLNFDTDTLMSDWSHKHVAWIAGLGQFGIHRMLITASGSAGRLGSLVTTAPLEATPRAAQPACLYELDGSCVACIGRCPVSALSVDGFDRHACWGLCCENGERNKGTGLEDACGKCLSVVPCTSIDPVAARLAKAGVRASATAPHA